MEKYKTIDLFAGIGGLRLGFERTGRTETVFSSEIDKFARKTYEKPEWRVFEFSKEEVSKYHKHISLEEMMK